MVLLSACAGTREQPKAQVADVNLQLGVGYLRQGELDVALEKLQRALEAQPDRPEIHTALALTYARLEQPERADEHYREAIARATEGSAEEGSAHNNYGAFLCEQGKIDEASLHFRKAIENRRYQTPEGAVENLGLCALRAGEVDKAEGAFREALQRNPRMPVSLLELAKLEFQQGEYLKARAFIQRFHDVSTVRPESLYLGAQVERRLGDQEAAARYARLLISTFPESHEADMIDETDEAQEVR